MFDDKHPQINTQKTKKPRTQQHTILATYLNPNKGGYQTVRAHYLCAK